MKHTTLAIAFTVLVSGTAFAGGNPDEEQDGAMTRDPLPQAAPVIPDQHEIKRQIEAEIFSEPTLARKPLVVHTPDPVPVAAHEPKSECWAPFVWLANILPTGDDCYRDSNFHNPAAVGFSTIHGTRTVEVEKTDRFHGKFGKGYKGFYRAISKKYELTKKGYKARLGYSKRHGWKVHAKKTYTEEIQVPTVTRIRNDRIDRDRNGGTAGDSNGMRGRDVDTGDGGNDRF